MKVNELGVSEAGLDLDEVRVLAKELDNIGNKMRRMGVYLFGKGGNGTIRTAMKDPREDPIILVRLAERNGVWLGAGLLDDPEFEDQEAPAYVEQGA